MKYFHDPKNKQITFLDERFYTKDLVAFYPSVTTILDVYPKGFGFVQWLKDLGVNSEVVVQRAAETGSHIHDACDRYLKGEKVTWVGENGGVNYSLDEWVMFLKFVEFWNIYKPRLIKNEISLLDEELGFGGTLDLICEIDKSKFPLFGGIWLIDYKSGQSVYKSHDLQLSAYRKLWNKINKDIQIERMGIFHMRAMTRGENGKNIQGKGWALKEPEKSPEYLFSLFQHTFSIWKEENPNPKPKDRVYPDFAVWDKGVKI